MQTITTKTVMGSREVDAYVYGRFAAYPVAHYWCVGHVATGYALCVGLKQMQARRLAKNLNAAWQYDDITEADFKEKETPHYQEFVYTCRPLVAAARTNQN